MWETLVGVVAAAALSGSGWAIYQVFQVPSMKEDIAEIKGQVNAIYIHLIERPRANRESKTR